MRWTLLLALSACAEQGASNLMLHDAALDAAPGRTLDAAPTVLDATPAARDATRDAAAVDCTLSEQLRPYLHAGTRDCGIVPLNVTGTSEIVERTEQARSCVRAALASGEPFVVSKQEQGIDSLIWTGFVREQQGGPVRMLSSDGLFSHNVVLEQRCEALLEVSRCEPMSYQLCFVCDQPTLQPTLLCST